MLDLSFLNPDWYGRSYCSLKIIQPWHSPFFQATWKWLHSWQQSKPLMCTATSVRFQEARVQADSPGPQGNRFGQLSHVETVHHRRVVRMESQWQSPQETANADRNPNYCILLDVYVKCSLGWILKTLALLSVSHVKVPTVICNGHRRERVLPWNEVDSAPDFSQKERFCLKSHEISSRFELERDFRGACWPFLGRASLKGLSRL